MKTNDEEIHLKLPDLVRFANEHKAIAWCTYDGPMWPGSTVQNQFVRILYPRGQELRTVEYARPLFSKSKQLHPVAETEAPTTREEFATLYGAHEIHWRDGSWPTK